MPNRIGVVSDTHNNLVNVRDIVALFTAAQVSRMVHAGDITQAKTLDALAGLEMPSAWRDWHRQHLRSVDALARRRRQTASGRASIGLTHAWAALAEFTF